MRYTEPKVVNTVNATTSIMGSQNKNALTASDSVIPSNPHMQTTPGYEADE